MVNVSLTRFLTDSYLRHRRGHATRPVSPACAESANPANSPSRRAGPSVALDDRRGRPGPRWPAITEGPYYTANLHHPVNRPGVVLRRIIRWLVTCRNGRLGGVAGARFPEPGPEHPEMPTPRTPVHVLSLLVYLPDALPRVPEPVEFHLGYEKPPVRISATGRDDLAAHAPKFAHSALRQMRE